MSYQNAPDACILVFISSVGLAIAAAKPPLRLPASSLVQKEDSGALPVPLLAVRLVALLALLLLLPPPPAAAAAPAATLCATTLPLLAVAALLRVAPLALPPAAARVTATGTAGDSGDPGDTCWTPEGAASAASACFTGPYSPRRSPPYTNPRASAGGSPFHSAPTPSSRAIAAAVDTSPGGRCRGWESGEAGCMGPRGTGAICGPPAAAFAAGGAADAAVNGAAGAALSPLADGVALAVGFGRSCRRVFTTSMGLVQVVAVPTLMPLTVISTIAL